MGKLLYAFALIAVFVCISVEESNGQLALGFVLNGVTYPSSSTVLRTDIGEGDAALQCTTNKITCCTNQNGETRAGEFYFPNGSMVLKSESSPSNSYYRNRATQLIRLNRRPTATQTGRFRCAIPSADSETQTVDLFINIVDVSLSITASGTNTAGETYSLECSATVTGSTDQPTITWLDSMNNTVPSEMVNTTGSMSTLTFNPLAASHAGIYACRGMVGGAVQSETTEITVQNPTITVTVTADVATPMAGSMYSITCTVTGAEGLTNSTTNYQWFKNGEVVSSQTMETLSFTSLSFSDAGGYTCQATIMSNLLSGHISMSSTDTVEIRLTLPNPAVNVTSDQPNPIRPTGSTVTLTCTVVLAEYVEGLTVNTEWSGPNGFSENEMAQRMGSTTTYISTAMVSSFERDQSGDYICTATVNSTSSFLTNSTGSSSTRVTVGVYLSRNGMLQANNSAFYISDISNTDNTRLQCITDAVSCCDTDPAGEWFFPDGGMVPIQSSATSFYRTRFDNGTVNLNRLNNDVMMPTGMFCCVVPDATSTDVTICANIAPDNASETPTNTTGNTTDEATTTEATSDEATTTEATSDEATTTEATSDEPTTTEVTSDEPTTTEATDAPIIATTTMVSDNETTTTEMVSSGDQMPTIMTPDPNITVTVTDDVATPMAGSMYSLNCTVSGAEGLTDSTTNYQWFKNGEVVSSQTMDTFSFTSLSFSDAGGYTCQATVMSNLLSEPITMNSTNTVEVPLTLPNPTVTVTSDQPNPIGSVGANVTLTCTVEFTLMVDVPVTVNTVWTGPNGFMNTSTAQPLMGSTTTYTSTAMVSSFGRDQSEDYTCTATVNSTTPFLISSGSISGTINVIIGVYLSLKGVVYPNNSVILITEIEQTNTTSNNGLQCITDRRPCCATPPNRHGEWFFPDNGGMVPNSASATTFYRNRGDDGTVNLNRVNNDVMMPTGRFCCVVLNTNDVNQTVCTNIVSINVDITTSGSPSAGETFSLECSISGTSDNATFQWLRGSPDNRTQLTSDGSRTINSTSSVSQLQFSPLRASHGELYTCQVVVGGVALEETTTVQVDLPAPSNVTVTPSVDTIIAGSSPNLTCTVELNSLVDVPVTVETVWSGPASTTVTTTNLTMESLTRYIILGMVDEARNGSYTCQATVSSSSEFTTGGGMTSGSTTITVAPLPPPTNLAVSGTSATSISLIWDQPLGADAVNGFKITYTYVVNECRGENQLPFPPVTVTLNNGSLRGYTITNSSLFPVEEDSVFTISITAFNSVTESNPSNTATTTTAQAAPGVVQSLNFSSVSVTNITIQWDRVACQDRNGEVDAYRVTYYPTEDPTDSNSEPISLDNNRMFSVTRLPPRTSYTFEVEAQNTDLFVLGAPAILVVGTSAPQNFGFLLNGTLYPNDSVVTLTDIGSTFSGPALFCLTPSTECCSDTETPNEATVTREWYLPDGRQLSSAGTVFSREQVSSAVSLYRNGGTSLSGVFRCDVPDASGNSQSIFIGLYPSTDGRPSITSVLFDRDNTTLTCTSTGGPPTSVTWRKNGVPVNNSLYQQGQRVVDTETATYENILFNDDVSNFVGTFSCEVSNVRGTAQDTVELNGLSIIRDQFTVGGSATAICKSDTLPDTIEWLTDGVVVKSATSTQQLDLVFALVTDSIHNQNYTCRVTREGGMTATQNFTVKVDVPPDAVTSSVSRSGTARAGMIYSLTCTVSKISGFVNSPTATWTIGGVAVSNGNDITVSFTTNDTSSSSTLTFDPLRTSHGNIYSCDGSLTSPALNSPLIPSTVENNYVQISTPNISIIVPPGPLYAGRTTPLTLTCTISINSATDTTISVTDMDITWLNGSAYLSNSSDRVTISPLSGSQQPFTSNLTLSPLSTFDSTSFTCSAEANPPPNEMTLVTASAQGEGTVSVTVFSPLPPTVSIVHSISPVMAGQPLTLTCSATVQEGIDVSPTLTWTRDGVEQSNGSVLTFDPLLTSHGGVYTCTARLNIPEAGVDVYGTNTTIVVVQIPPPLVTISGSPRNMSFFQGLNLTFTCSITLDAVVDTSVTVQGIWNRNGTELVNGIDNGTITVSYAPLAMPPYQTTVTFNPLNNITDNGTYECSATVTPQDTTFVTGTTSSNSRNISVEGFPKQLVDLITDEGTSTAGFSGYTLICSTSKEPDLPPTSSLAVEWLDPSGNVINNGTNFTVSGSGRTTDIVLTSRLTFNNLYTSQSGEYTCRTLQTIVGTVTDHPEPVYFTVNVKLPALLPLMFRQSRNTTLYAGTNFSLTCLITPNTTGVDTEFTVESSVTGPGTSELGRVSISLPTSVEGGVYETVVAFSHLLEGDEGPYNCSARATSSQSNVIASEPTSAAKTITVKPLPPPDVTVSNSSVTLAGEQLSLTCTATVIEFLIIPPTLTWRLPGDTGDTSVGVTSRFETTSNITLNFNPLRTSHGGVYVCEATVNISGVLTESQTANDTVRVQISPPVISVRDHVIVYNGTNFTLTGVVELHGNVDTDVTVSGIWSSGDGPQESTSPPYLTNLTFQPLATNSSREYTLTASVQPSGNSLFIVGNSGNYSYSLSVQPLPSRPPTITVASRHPSSDDGCGETMTLNCTANQVDNLFTPPTITWRDPNGTPVTTERGSNPRVDPETRQLIFSDINSRNQGTYTCQAVINIPQALIINYIDMDTTEVNTKSPGAVQNLKCTKSTSSSELSFSWELPTVLGNEVIDYRVEVKGLRHRPGTREVVQDNVDGFNTEMKETTISQEINGEVPYNITVRALNLAGCGEVQQIYCFTEEGVPVEPADVDVERIDSTTMTVSWSKQTLVELKGLANYTITYSVSGGGSRKRQTGEEGTVMVPWTENSVTITNLRPNAAYDVSVSTVTSAGSSASSVGNMLPAQSTFDAAAVIGAIIAALLVAAVVVVAIVIVVILYKRHRTSKFSPGHHYDVGTVSESRELQQVVSQPASPLNDKEKEALEESSLFKPATPQRSALTTEVLDRMKSVSLTSFRDHVASKHEDRDKGFESEYQSFGTDPVNNHDIAKLPINRAKNRFANIFPYDHSRVILNDVPGEEGSDYINACSLDGYKREGCYIAAQGPLPNTISDFWRMIWERRMPNIVMLTKCLEAGRRKCEQYWADNIGEDYMTPDKKLNITTTSVMPYADFVIRTFSLKSLTDATLDPLSVTQYHFTSWPDHGVPKFATSLISFIRRVQRGHTKDSGRQLLVHCSAGVGRTGTFITLDSMLDRMAAKEADVNVYEFVYKMRQRRVLMVQTLAQYVFIHDALNELITCGQTDIVASALRTKVNFLSKIIPAKGITGFQNQFQLLEQASREPADEDITDAMEPFNQKKNRYMDKIPYNMSRARLRPTGEDGSEYINASFIDGYKQRNAYIATQGPLQDTVNDVWRMLYEFKSRTMVMLCNMNEEGQEAAYPFFPGKEEEPVKYGKMLVTLQSKAAYTDFIVRRFSIQEDKQSSPKNDGFVVTQFHLTEWSPTAVPNTGILIEMLDMITKNQMNTGNRPITVMCNDGVGRTGTFICIHAQLERLKTEGVVDFFQSIKSARIQRAELVPNVDQYAFCHTALADYIDKFDNYANFKDMI